MFVILWMLDVVNQYQVFLYLFFWAGEKEYKLGFIMLLVYSSYRA